MTPDRTVSFWCAVAVGTLCGLVVAATWLPLGWVVSEAVTFSLLILIFPLFGWTVVREASAGGKPNPNVLLRRVPQPAKVIVGVVWVVLCLSTVSTFFGPFGQPTTRDGRLYLNNHGEFTEVDRDTYDAAQNRDARGFMSVATAFSVAAAVMSKYGGREDAR